jgi:hypothetical protein
MTENSVGTAIATGTTAVENNFLWAAPYVLGALTVGSTAYSAYEVYDTYQQEGPEAALQKAGMEVAFMAAGAAAGKLAVKVGGKIYPSIEAAWQSYISTSPKLAELVASGASSLNQAKHAIETSAVGQTVSRLEAAGETLISKGKEKIVPSGLLSKGTEKAEHSLVQPSVKSSAKPHETPARLELGNRPSSSHPDVDNFTHATIRNNASHSPATKPVIITSTTTTTSTTSVCTITTTSTTTTTVAPALIYPQKNPIISSNFSKLTKQYARDMETRSGIKITDQQRLTLKNELQSKKFEKLLPERYAEHRKIYTDKKAEQIRSDWEKNTGQKWPTYLENGYKKNGGTLYEVGDPYQIHHIIHQSHGGPHKWWNVHPVPQSGHQGGIHGSKAPGQKLHGK